MSNSDVHELDYIAVHFILFNKEVMNKIGRIRVLWLQPTRISMARGEGFHISKSLGCEEETGKIIKITRMKEKIGFVGDGNMARAICKGIVNKGLIDYSQVYVSSPYVKNLDRWKVLGANVSTDNGDIVNKADVVFLAVKPHILCAAVDIIAKSQHGKQIKDKLFVSILAGFKIAKLEELNNNKPYTILDGFDVNDGVHSKPFDNSHESVTINRQLKIHEIFELLSVFQGSRVVRLMPNTPMLLGEGCTAYSPGNNVTDYDISIVRAILEATGICSRVPEHMINAVTAVSGAGPAYAYLIIEALSDGGVRMGLHRDTATKFAAQTMLGAAKMVLEAGKHTGQLKDQVCSAGGATIAGMHELEKGGVRGAIMNAVEASAKRADVLGGDN